MRKMYVEDLQPGMVLGKTIYNERGNVLLARGVALSPRYIEALRSLGFYAVYIMDGIADDVEPSDILSDNVRTTIYKHVRELFNLGRAALGTHTTRNHRRAIPSQPAVALPNLAQLYRDIEKIIDVAMDAEILSGVGSLKSHDTLTFEHSVEVAVAAVMLGLRLHLPFEELRQLALGAFLHDIGKVSVPKEILNKPGPLAAEEYELVKRHSETGYEIMQKITGESDIVARHVVLQHHERQDGGGYPRGLQGTNEYGSPPQERFGKSLILPAAEIVAVAEVYTALASDQPYRRAMPPAEVAATLRRMAGSHLNREVVRRFLSILPAYPVATEVVLISGALQGHRGIVTEINPAAIDRPKVRVLFDPNGKPIPPFEVDCSEQSDIQLATPSYSEGLELRPAGLPQATLTEARQASEQ